MSYDDYEKELNIDHFSKHLEKTYDIQVRKITELDLGVFRVDRNDGKSLIARLYPEAWPPENIKGLNEILMHLKSIEFPSEHSVDKNAVSVYEGRGVLLTEYAAGRKPKGSIRIFKILGVLLGRLHSLPVTSDAMAGSDGAWHHFMIQGGPREEIDAALSLLNDFKDRVPKDQITDYETLRNELELSDDFHDLPRALTHPDFVPSNVIITSEPGVVVIDWTGVGRAPRIFSLGLLLWAAGLRDLDRVDAVAAGYQRYISLQPDELSRLYGAIKARPIIFDIWSLCNGRKSLAEVTAGIPKIKEKSKLIAERALRVFEYGASQN